MVERPFRPAEDDYLVYTFNRFQACRFGYAGTYVDPRTHERRTLRDEILETLARIEQHAIELHADTACGELAAAVARGENDAAWMRAVHADERSLPEVVRQQTLRWRED
jgi:carboxylate-amine ligase